MRRHSWLVLVFVPLMLSASSRAVEPAPVEEEPIYQGKTLAEWIDDLKDPKKDNHSAAAQALAVFGPKQEVVSALTTALNSDDAKLVLSAAQNLGKFGPKAKEALLGLRAAYKRLKEDGSQRLTPMQTKEDQKMFAEARRAVAEALILIDDHPGPTAGDALAKFGARAKAAIPVLLPRLRNSDPETRGGFCLLLGEFGPAAKDAIPALEKISREDSDKRVRLTAYTALAQIDSSRVKDTVRRLTAALPSKVENSSSILSEETVSDIAVQCLTLLGSDARDALPTLRALREKSTDRNVKESIGEVINKIENPKKPPTDR